LVDKKKMPPVPGLELYDFYFSIKILPFQVLLMEWPGDTKNVILPHLPI
jgi:hypothetical protein